ncbi:MAG: TIGR03618 family F420-dependent PPOX class oxidoreductase [Dehalococcoidia bacterium]|nr:TIGR03618 family F420-dependent PPOX class oxidoreductase [Dehalococcoidia bacterium]
MPEMTASEADEFLRETRIAKLAYLHAGGAPTIVPVWFEWDGEVARVFTSRTSPKARRIAADPRVALTVEEPVGVHECWVTIEGTAAVSDAGTVELLKRLARRYYQPVQAEQAITSWTAKPEMWVTLTITPSRIRSSK